MKKKNRASVSSKPIKMTDAELSKKLGHYQAMSVIWFWVGVVGAVSGAIFYFVLQNKALKSLLVAVLFFGGIFCASFFALSYATYSAFDFGAIDKYTTACVKFTEHSGIPIKWLA